MSASMAALLLAASPALFARPEPSARPGDLRPVVEVGRYRLQSNPWVNLHQRLLYEARFPVPPPSALAGEDLAKWKSAVESYRALFGRRNPIHDGELIRMNAALAAAADASGPPASIPSAATAALQAAMPLYRSGPWEEDDRANRFWMALAEPMLRAASEELAEAHAKVYGVPFPRRILVDVSPRAWEFGSYTVGEGESAHVVISSTEPGNQGFAALELLLHEPSHAIVGPDSGAIGPDVLRVAARLGVRAPSSLWHGILFYTSGELTRRALARRGVADYRPIITAMYDVVFPGLRKPLETHWQAYLDGKVSRETAIEEILKETSAAKKTP